MSARRTALTVADIRMEMVARVAAAAALIVVLASFAYSFSAMKWVSDRLGADPDVLSYVFPFIIDLPALVASALTVALHDRPLHVRQYAWSVLILFTSLSWLCNAIHAVEKSTIPAMIGDPWGTGLVVLIAGFPPIGIVLGVHLWAFALRHSASADQRAATPMPVAQPAPRTRTIAPEPMRVRVSHPPRTPVSSTVRDAAHDVYESLREPGHKPSAARIHKVISGMAQAPTNAATTRRWVADWWARDEHNPDRDQPHSVPPLSDHEVA